MDSIKTGEQVLLNEEVVSEYLKSDKALRLDGDSKRNLSLRKDCHDFFLRGKFDNNEVLIAMVSWTEEEGFDYACQYIPSDCIKKHPNPISAPIDIKVLPNEVLNYNSYQKEIDDRLKKASDLFSDMTILDSRFTNYINTIVSAITFSSSFKNWEEITVMIPKDYLNHYGKLRIILSKLTEASEQNVNLVVDKYKTAKNFVEGIPEISSLKNILVKCELKVNEERNDYEGLELILKQK